MERQVSFAAEYYFSYCFYFTKLGNGDLCCKQ